MNDEDDLIRESLRRYAYGDTPIVDATALQRRREARRRRQQLMRLATAAVVLLVFCGVVAWIATSRPSSVPPVTPTPLPTPTASLTSTPSLTPSATSAAGYPEQPRSADTLPSGGLGDTVEGLQLTAIEITDAECTDASRCPGSGTLTVQNTTDKPIQAAVFFFVFRNNSPAVGDGKDVSLAPGEEVTVTINVQPMLADSAPAGQSGSLYSWNFAVDRS